MLASVSGRESAVERASRRHRQRVTELGGEIREARLGLGLSLRAIVGRVAASPSKVSRIERGRSPRVPLCDLGAVAAAVGLDLSVRLFPGPRPTRDAAHLRLLARLRERVHPSLVWRTEVPLPIPGDQRAWDAVIAGASFNVAVEAETRLLDLQALERRIGLKARDGGMGVVILLVADTRLNRDAVRGSGPSALSAFAAAPRSVLEALREGREPEGGSVVFL
jgi:transcriptional regulator with XRE-family HTH domain